MKDLCDAVLSAQLIGKISGDGRLSVDVTDPSFACLVSHLKGKPYDVAVCQNQRFLLRLQEEGDRLMLYVAPDG